MLDQPITVCFPFVGDTLGGSHISASKLIAALDPNRVRALAALHDTTGPLADYLSSSGIPFVQAPKIPLPGKGQLGKKSALTRYFTAGVGPITLFLRRNGVDLVHTNDGRMHVGWALPARLAGARQIWHHRGDPDALGARIVAPLLAGHIFSVSRFARPRRPFLPIERKLTVLHSPFDRPASRPDRKAARAAVLEAIGASAETHILSSFGMLIDRKRPLRFVEIVAAHVRRHPEVPVAGLLFGAPGPENPGAEQEIRAHAAGLGIGQHIFLMGYRSPVDRWMAGSDALIVPAVREPFGRTLIEAMFLGTPVVATDDGGNPEAITHGRTGLLVPPDRPEAFVEPINRLLTDQPLRDRIAEAARAEAESRYSTARHVEAVCRIYERLTGASDLEMPVPTAAGIAE